MEGNVPVFFTDHWYWCFTSKAGPDICGATQELCAQWMGAMGTGTGCVPAPQGVCFHTSSDGEKLDGGLCLRTVDECKAAVAVWAADKTGPKVKVGCTIFRAANAPGAPARAVDRPSKRWWCSVTSDGYAGACFKSEDECTVFRELGRTQSAILGACAQQRFVVCMTARSSNGVADTRCAPDLEKCNTMREVLARDSKRGSLTECEVTN